MLARLEIQQKKRNISKYQQLNVFVISIENAHFLRFLARILCILLIFVECVQALTKSNTTSLRTVGHHGESPVRFADPELPPLGYKGGRTPQPHVLMPQAQAMLQAQAVSPLARGEVVFSLER